MPTELTASRRESARRQALMRASSDGFAGAALRDAARVYLTTTNLHDLGVCLAQIPNAARDPEPRKSPPASVVRELPDAIERTRTALDSFLIEQGRGGDYDVRRSQNAGPHVRTSTLRVCRSSRRCRSSSRYHSRPTDVFAATSLYKARTSASVIASSCSMVGANAPFPPVCVQIVSRSRRENRLISVGAPRFELGTSSPPD